MSEPDALPRRVFLGLELRARRAEENPKPGLLVLRVTAEGTAARVNIRPGDRLLSFCGAPIQEAAELVSTLRALAPGAPVEFGVEREGAELILAGEAVPLPVERIEGADVTLGHVAVRGARLRTIFTTPRGPARPRIVVLYLPGIGSASVELSLGCG